MMFAILACYGITLILSVGAYKEFLEHNKIKEDKEIAIWYFSFSIIFVIFNAISLIKLFKLFF